MRRRTLVAGVAGTFATAVLTGCAGGRVAASGAAPVAQPADLRAGTVETFRAALRKPAPAVTGELLNGAAFDLATWRGKIVVINFWGSWCAPCRAETPELQTTFQATKKLGVEFLGIDIRDDRDAANAFVNAFGVTYPSLYDPPGRVVLGFKDVPPNVIPATVLLDRQMRIAAVFRKRVTGRELEAAIRALAGETDD